MFSRDPLPGARVVTIDHPSSLLRSWIRGAMLPLEHATRETLAVLFGLWPLTAAVTLLAVLAVSAALG
jgi:hypothetical protein